MGTHPQKKAFTSTRGSLRYVLGQYVKERPQDIQFKYAAEGKPAVDSSSKIQFNLSHSSGLAAVVLTADYGLGIDVERVRALPDLQSIATQFFCREEAAHIMSLPHSEQALAFFLLLDAKRSTA